MKLLATTLALSITLISYAQIVDKTEEKAKEKTTQRVDEKIDKGIDSGLDAIEGLFKKKNKKPSEPHQTEKNESSPTQEVNFYSSTSSDEVKDEYKFDHNVVLRSIMFDKQGKETLNQLITMYFSDESSTFGMEMNSQQTGKTTIVYDYDNRQMVTLINMQSQKMGMVAAINTDELMDDSTAEEDSRIIFTKTGQEKSISGYHCIEYLIEDTESDDDMVQKIWMAPDAEVNWMQGISGQGEPKGMMSPSQGLPKNLPEGALVQINIEDEKGRPTMMTVIESANMNAAQIISTSGFTFMNIGGMIPTE